MRLLAAALTCAMLSACTGSSAPDAAQPADMPEGGYASDIGERQIPPDAGPAPEADVYPLAPSAAAKTPCADDGDRLPLSGVCRGRAVAYMDVDDSTPMDAPAGCEWEVNEVWFAGDVLLYRALTCGEKHVALEYAGGAHAAELSYTASALHPEAVQDPNDIEAHHPIVRIASYWKDDDFRLKETIGSDADIAQCEIRAAGPGYPTGAKVIAPKVAGADCGGYALSETADNFWLVGKEWVFTFMLPKGARDIDPGSFKVVTPQ